MTGENYCIKNDTLYKNCDTKDQSNNKCIACEDGYYLNRGACCLESTEVLDPEKGTCETGIGTVDQCLTYSDKDTCTQCEEDYYLASPSICCIHNSLLVGVDPDQECLSIDKVITNCAYFDTNTR